MTIVVAAATERPTTRMNRLLFAVFLLLQPFSLLAQGNVYFVIGSDTGIWDGLDVGRYTMNFSEGLYADPARNMSRVMESAFRDSLRDPFGTPMKLTWWTMAGNIFRNSTNTNVASPSTMVFELIKRYHGDALTRWGDELTLHYHTWVWYDDNGDGLFYWNQARQFSQTARDFDETLAELLLDEELFPVSFRSGWHAMDDDWQHRLNEVLPYSLHNDWPARRNEMAEPLDNIYDWSTSPSSFVPFRPSLTDYRVPGDGPGWNVRSKYLAGADSAFMAGIFAQAAAGYDQVVCLWAHVPEPDFPDNLKKVHNAATRALAGFAGVTFRYCTAVEAMQRWRGTTDTTAPSMNVTEIREADRVRWRIAVDEPIFQPAPFAAVKTRFGERLMLASRPTGDRVWETTQGMIANDLIAFGVAATDTSGNVAISRARYRPADVLVDDTDAGYSEIRGTWTNAPQAVWGRTARATTVPVGDSAIVEWMVPLPEAGKFQIDLLTGGITAPGGGVEISVMEGASLRAVRTYPVGVERGVWKFIAAVESVAPTTLTVRLVVRAGAAEVAQATVDAVRRTSSIRDQWFVAPDRVDVGECIVATPVEFRLQLRNQGLLPIHITSGQSWSGTVTFTQPFPLAIGPMDSAELIVRILPNSTGSLHDTLSIASDDPRNAVRIVALTGNVSEYFVIVDNGEPEHYSETGSWFFSNARAFGPTSRFAAPSVNTSASFEARLAESGQYDIMSIVPVTSNASTRARYQLWTGGLLIDSVFVDQNVSSGAWNPLFHRWLPVGTNARVVVSDAMSPVQSNRVLRADAVRFQWLTATSASREPLVDDVPKVLALQPNFPNPFNPSTTITFQLPTTGRFSLRVVDLLGREVENLCEGIGVAGSASIAWDASRIPSGVYFGVLEFEGRRVVRTMQLIR